MQMLRYFWDAVVELDKNAKKFDEGIRFPLCRKGRLESLIQEIGLKHLESKAIEKCIKSIDNTSVVNFKHRKIIEFRYLQLI